MGHRVVFARAYGLVQLASPMNSRVGFSIDDPSGSRVGQRARVWAAGSRMGSGLIRPSGSRDGSGLAGRAAGECDLQVK